MESIGIFGGTFDPIHKGHLYIIEQTQHLFSFTQLFVVPNASPPHRSPTTASATARLQMVELACQGFSRVYVDNQELLRNSPSYSIDTILSVKQKHSQAYLYFIMGVDSFLAIQKWHKYDEILKNCNVVLFHRDQKVSLDVISQLCQQIQSSNNNLILTPVSYESFKTSQHKIPHGQIILTDILPPTISATQIRRELQQQNVCDDIPRNVYEHIQAHSLYQ